MMHQPGRFATVGHSSGSVAAIAALLAERTGQQIEPGRQWRIESLLTPVLRAHDVPNLDVLVARIRSGTSSGLVTAIVDALVNGETSFFRDGTVLDQVVSAVTHLEAATGIRRLRIWCAGCSTGQEPLSLAMLFAERAERAGALSPDLLATDVSTAAIARARLGRFSQFEIQRGLPIRRMLNWFTDAEGHWHAQPELLRQIVFRQHNLVADPAPPGRFDMILCRNVLLYLPPATRRVVFDRLAAALRPGGMVVLGAGETVIGQTMALMPSMRFRGFYRRACDAE